MSEFTTVTRKGWGIRSKNSIGRAIFGFILAALAIVLLFWNEGRAVKRYKDLKEGAGIVVSTDSSAVDSNEGREACSCNRRSEDLRSPEGRGIRHQRASDQADPKRGNVSVG
jgi:hypothetical protein